MIHEDRRSLREPPELFFTGDGDNHVQSQFANIEKGNAGHGDAQDDNRGNLDSNNKMNFTSLKIELRILTSLHLRR